MNNPDEIDIDMDDANDTEADVEEGNTQSIITHLRFSFITFHHM